MQKFPLFILFLGASCIAPPQHDMNRL